MNSANKKSLGEQLRRAREKKGCHQEDFANLLGISRPRLCPGGCRFLLPPFDAGFGLLMLLDAGEERIRLEAFNRVVRKNLGAVGGREGLFYAIQAQEN